MDPPSNVSWLRLSRLCGRYTGVNKRVLGGLTFGTRLWRVKIAKMRRGDRGICIKAVATNLQLHWLENLVQFWVLGLVEVESQPGLLEAHWLH